ncbi:hypothetical protein PA598K_05197 [Paenibacillus sp. 598K]|nr:hypothetical protein PA598K_05197 [Paenibacillus sp. 598K]
MTLSVDGDEPVVRVAISGKGVQAAIQVGASGNLELQTPFGAYRLPLAVLRETSASAEVVLTMAEMDASYTAAWQAGLRAAGMEPAVAAPVDFRLEVDGRPFGDLGGVYVERSVRLIGGEAPTGASAVRMDDSGQPHFAPHTSAGSELWIKSTDHGVYGVIRYERTFPDLEGHWGQVEIEQMASKLIVQGVAPDRFAPGAAVTRAEFAVLLVRALGLSAAAESPPTSDRPSGEDAASSPSGQVAGYRDVGATAWYADAVRAAVEAGLVSGFEDGTFRPAQTITREQMAVLLMRALAYTGATVKADNAALERFGDAADVAAWAREAVAAALGHGLMQGVTETAIGPQSPATRAESVVMLYRLLREAGFIDGV